MGSSLILLPRVQTSRNGMKLFGILLSFGSVLGALAGNSWNYAGHGEYWPTSHAKSSTGAESYWDCDGIRQSPIDINSSMVQDVYFWNQLNLANYAASYAGKFKNNGHTLQFDLDDAETSGATLPTFSSPFMCTGCSYELQQFHFHWGSTAYQGSEHTKEGIAFPMELHLVHKKTSYSSVTASLSYNDGLAVIGIMFQLADTSDAGLTEIINAAVAIKNAADQHTHKEAKSIDMSTFLYQTGRSYYYYKGSLTTPPCTETVDWHLMEGAIRITEADLEKLRDLTYTDDAPLVDNYRLPMPLNNRIIKRVFN